VGDGARVEELHAVAERRAAAEVLEEALAAAERMGAHYP
jgi:hypothetical protein